MTRRLVLCLAAVAFALVTCQGAAVQPDTKSPNASTPSSAAAPTPTSSGTTTSRPSASPTHSTRTSPPSPIPDVDPLSGLPLIDPAGLPPEVADTLDLIAAGGPFPFDRDGITFENREGILPDQPNGYYHEYTVPTPGSSDRGARRVIIGKPDEAYYTGDHYDSFVRLLWP